ncbi:MAG TPA: radical SAM protein [Methanocellales archaeon]|nr:radical SAM protein [Methanocellales archaeon]
MKLLAYQMFGIKAFLEIEDKKIKAMTEGPLSFLAKPICEKFNDHFSGQPATILKDGIFISTVFPLVPSEPFRKLVGAQLKNHLFGTFTPECVAIMVTSRCQCKCQHCIAYGITGKEELSTDEIYDLIDQSLELGAYQISFEGGEPTLRSDLPELVSHIDKSKAISRVVTNGLLLTEEYVRRLKRAGLDILTISLDSPYLEIHDRFRGVAGLFDRVTEGIKHAVKSGLIVCVIYVASPQNSDSETMNDLLEYCESLGVHELLIDEIFASGKWSGKDVLADRDRERLIDLARTQERNICVTPFFHLRNPDLFGCFAGRRWMFISPTGDVMPCMHTPVSFGNIRDMALKDIWKSIRRHPLFRKKPETCTINDPCFKENYLRKIPKDADLPYPIEKLD